MSTTSDLTAISASSRKEAATHPANLATIQTAREQVLDQLVEVAATNLIGADFASITVRHKDGTLETVAASDPLADELDEVQYRFGEGPCYSAVTDERFVLVNNMADSPRFPNYAPQAAAHGVGTQSAMQLVSNGDRAGLNVYGRRAGAFNKTTLLLAELLAAQGAIMLGYAQQLEGLGQAVKTRQDIGTAVGIVMERFGLAQPRAFAYLVRLSQTRNTKLRLIARQIVERAFSEADGNKLCEPWTTLHHRQTPDLISPPIASMTPTSTRDWSSSWSCTANN